MRPTSEPRSTRRRGLIITDCVIGLGILAALLTITAITVNHDKRVNRAAAAHRQLTFEAEFALAALQANQPLPTPASPSVTLTHSVLEAKAIPVGYIWLSITASDGKRSSEIIGLVPSGTESALAEEGVSP